MNNRLNRRRNKILREVRRRIADREVVTIGEALQAMYEEGSIRNTERSKLGTMVDGLLDGCIDLEEWLVQNHEPARAARDAMVRTGHWSEKVRATRLAWIDWMMTR